MYSKHSKHRRTTGGFTLVEMIVVLGIAMVITLIVLVKNRDFTDTLLINSLAYDVALAVREAQVYGLGVREAADETTFDLAYGVSVDMDEPTGIDLFADADDDGVYDAGELVERYTMASGFSFGDVCAVTDGTSACGRDSAAVTFKRPDPDARFEVLPAEPDVTAIEFRIVSPVGRGKTVLVESTGHVAVE